MPVGRNSPLRFDPKKYEWPPDVDARSERPYSRGEANSPAFEMLSPKASADLDHRPNWHRFLPPELARPNWLSAQQMNDNDDDSAEVASLFRDLPKLILAGILAVFGCGSLEVGAGRPDEGVDAGPQSCEPGTVWCADDHTVAFCLEGGFVYEQPCRRSTFCVETDHPVDGRHAGCGANDSCLPIEDVEVSCDGLDNDCDGLIDEEDICAEECDEWIKPFGGQGNNYLCDLNIDGARILLAGGNASHPGAEGIPDAWLIETDPSGNEMWSNHFGGSASEMLYTVIPTIGGGIGAAGYTESFGAGGSDAFFANLGPMREVLWEGALAYGGMVYGGPDHDSAEDVQQMRDETFYLLGNSWPADGGETRAWVRRIDPSTGDELWVRNWDFDEDPFTARAFHVTEDGSIFMTGCSPAHGGIDARVVKMTPSWQREWDVTIGGPGADIVVDDLAFHGCFSEMKRTRDGTHLLLAGYGARGPRNAPGNTKDAMYARISLSGEPDAVRFSDDPFVDEAHSIAGRYDGGYVATGQRENPDGRTDAFLDWLDHSLQLERREMLYGGYMFSVGLSVGVLPDGGTLVAGSGFTPGESAHDGFLRKECANLP